MVRIIRLITVFQLYHCVLSLRAGLIHMFIIPGISQQRAHHPIATLPTCSKVAEISSCFLNKLATYCHQNKYQRKGIFM